MGGNLTGEYQARICKSICSVARCPVPLSTLIKPTHTFSLACGCAGCGGQLRSARFLAFHQPTAVLLSVLFTCEDRGTARLQGHLPAFPLPGHPCSRHHGLPGSASVLAHDRSTLTLGPGGLPPWRALLTLECQDPSGVLERSTGRSLGLGVGSGRSDLHRLRPHTWPLPRDHFHRPGSGGAAPPRPVPSSVPGSQAQGRVISEDPPGAAPLPPPTSWPQGAQRTLKTRGRRRRSLGGRRVGAGMGARGKVHEGLSGLQAGGPRRERARGPRGARQVRPAGRGGAPGPGGGRGGRARPAAARVVCAAPAPGNRRPPRRKPRPRARPVPARWSGCWRGAAARHGGARAQASGRSGGRRPGRATRRARGGARRTGRGPRPPAPFHGQLALAQQGPAAR